MSRRGRVIRRCGKVLTGASVCLLAASASFAAGSTAATDRISGVVRNGSRGTVAAHDEVVLLRMGAPVESASGRAAEKFQLTHNAHEEASTFTDWRGSFTFTLPMRRRDATYLLRVIHQGIPYERPIAAGDSVSVDVFDSAAKVRDIAGTVEIIRIANNGKSLHVSDMIEIRNDSSPPVTLNGDRTFEVYLPLHAKISSVLAAGPGTGADNIGEMISAAALPDEPGHYAVRFPLRPGSTKLAFNYDVPYEGGVKFVSRRKYAVRQLAVMIPPTMKFTPSYSSSSPAFQVLSTGNNRYLVEGANQLPAGLGPEFEISREQVSPAQASPKLPVTFPLLPFARPLQSMPDLGAASITTFPSSSSSSSSMSLRLRRWAIASVVFLLAGLSGYWLRRKQRLSGAANASVAANRRALNHSQQCQIRVAEANGSRTHQS